jgi:DNA-binding transcriptional LysR family regulator
MRQDEIDVAILPDMKSEFDMVFEEFVEKFLFKDEMWLVGSGRDTGLPMHSDISEFISRPVAMFSEMYPGFRRILEKKVIDTGKQFMPVFETDNVGTLKRVIESGLGWGFLPSHSIRKQVRMRRLTLVQVDELKYSVNVNMYTRRVEKLRQMSDVLYRAIQQQALQ